MDHIKRQPVEVGRAWKVIFLSVGVTIAFGLLCYLSINSDARINDYYLNFHTAFHAADSGLSIARAQLLNQVKTSIPMTFSVSPIVSPSATATSAKAYLTSQYAGDTPLNTGQAENSWPESFKLTNVSFVLAAGSPTVTASDRKNNPTGYSYLYNYSLTTMGSAQGTDSATASESGSMKFNVNGTIVSSVAGRTQGATYVTSIATQRVYFARRFAQNSEVTRPWFLPGAEHVAAPDPRMSMPNEGTSYASYH